MAAKYQLVSKSGPHMGESFPLEASVIIIGREVGNSIVISDAEVSRRHAKLTWQGAAYFIEDAGSTNGTFVNNQRITAPHALKSGDLVSLSENITFVFEVISDPNATVIASSREVKAAVIASQTTPPTPMPAVPISAAPMPAAPIPVTAPPPHPVYPVQTPVAAPVSYQPPPVARKGSKIWIVLVVLLILGICACIGLFAAIDYLQLWCNPTLSWLTNIISPLIGGGLCP